jgi:hypothetical protein
MQNWLKLVVLALLFPMETLLTSLIVMSKELGW